MRAVFVAILVLGGCAHAGGGHTAAGEVTAQEPGELSAEEVRSLAAAAYADDDVARCAELYDAALRLGPETRNQAYDAACCMALAGREDAAFARLRVEMEQGFHDVSRLAADPDLSSLRDDPRWPGIEAAARRNLDVYLATIYPDLQAIRAAEAADCPLAGLRWGGADLYVLPEGVLVGARFEERRLRVNALVDVGAIVVAAEGMDVATVLCAHGKELSDFERANALAEQLLVLDPSNTAIRRLVAATEDRVLVHQGRPQKYGTEYRQVHGMWELYPLDPAISDVERAAWGVHPLAEARALADTWNMLDW